MKLHFNSTLLFSTNLTATITACVFIFIICVPTTLWLLYRSFQKKWTQKKKILMLTIEHENELLKAKVEIQEQAFKDISAEIHDNIGQRLSLARYQAERLIGQGIDAKDISSILHYAIADLRDLSHSLSADIVLEEGLSAALRKDVDRINNSNKIDAEYMQVGVVPILNNKSAMALYRVFQEALQNILRHSKADKVRVFLSREEGYIHLGITDNGIGILRGTEKGRGMKNMRTRLEALKGNLTIATDTNGTSLLAKIPVSS